MKNNKKKILASVTSICLSVLIFSSCSFGDGLGGLTNNNQNETLAENITTATADFQGNVHRFEATNTDKPFITSGESEYKVVYSAIATKDEQTAVTEFNTLFEMATNFTLPNIKDSDMQHTENGKYISIGNTTLLESSGIDTELDELGRDGCKVVTKDDTVYIFGGTEGVIYGVYNYMKVTFNYEYYYDDCIEIDTNVSNMKLKNYNVKDAPDLLHRWTGWSHLENAKETYAQTMSATRYRMRYGRGSNMLKFHAVMGDKNSANGGTHNSLECLPPDDYKEIHPEWYSTRGAGVKMSDGNYEDGQLCWSARSKPEDFADGNIPEAFEAMAQEISKKIQASLIIYTPEEYPEIDTVDLGVEDNSLFCQCEGCSAWKEKYGVDSAPGIALMNRVAEITDAWMETDEGKPYARDMAYTFLAYITFESAPVKWDETQSKYVPIDELVTPRENVGVYLAAIRLFDYQLSIDHELNAQGKMALDGWTDICNNTFLWLYQTNFRDIFAFYDSFNFFNDGYKYILSRGIKGSIIQGATSSIQYYHTSFSNLKMYLNAKLFWDANADVNKLIDNWFNAMFKEGAEDMKAMFNETRSWMAYMLDEYDLYKLRSCFTDLYKPEYWPLPMLNRWTSLCDAALEKVAKYQTKDPGLYEQISSYIELEWIAPAQWKLYLYSKDLSSADRTATVTRFADNIEKFKLVTRYEKGSELQDFIVSVS